MGPWAGNLDGGWKQAKKDGCCDGAEWSWRHDNDQGISLNALGMSLCVEVTMGNER